MAKIHRACRYYLNYANRHFCRLPWFTKGIMTDPEELRLGCHEDCKDLQIVEWKVDRFGEVDEAEDVDDNGKM